MSDEINPKDSTHTPPVTPPAAKPEATPPANKSFPSAQTVFAESTIRHVETLIRLDQLNEAVNELEEARRLAPGLVDHIYVRTLIIRAARKERDGNLEAALADYWAARAIIGVSDMAEKLDAIISEVRHNVEEKKRFESPIQHCNSCNRDIDPGWSNCPYCAAPLPNKPKVQPAQTQPTPPQGGLSEKTQPIHKTRHITDILKRLSGKTGKLG